MPKRQKGLRLRGRIWWIDITVNGIQHQFSTGTTDYKIALKIYFKVKNDISEGRWFDKLIGEYKSCRDLLEKYVNEVSPRKAPQSQRRDKSLAANLMEKLGKRMLVKMTPQEISDYKNKRRAEGRAPQTINNELALLRHAFNIAIREWEWVKNNPVVRVRKERVDNIRERCLSEEEEKKLLAESPKWLEEILIFSLETGLRQSEILDLEWSRVDLPRRSVFIERQKNRDKDMLPLNRRALAVLQGRAKIRHIGTNLVFYSKNGTRIGARNLMRAFYRACRKAKIEDLCFHDLRRSFATRLIRAGADPFRIRRLMRQKDPSVMDRYAHLDAESLRDTVEFLDKKNDKKMTMGELGNSESR